MDGPDSNIPSRLSGEGSSESDERDFLLNLVEQDVQLLIAILDHYLHTETEPPAFLHTAKVTAERSLELIARLRATAEGESEEPGRDPG